MIKFNNVTKSFKQVQVLKNVNFTIESGELVVIIGASGCGKTTTLKMINRLIKPTSGSIFIDDNDIASGDIISLRRKIGYVIQQTGLFPHMTIKENIEIIPKLQKIDKDTLRENTINLLNMIGLDFDEYADRYPSELSGGQQQRIGVARAFATNPDIILMDEPFSALDPVTRNDLQEELINLHQSLHKTIVFVTHDMTEAIKIADKICIMDGGSIIQYDTPENILKNPANEFVSNFVGKNRIWDSPEFIKISDIMLEHPVICYPTLSLLKCMEKMRISRVDSLMIIEPKTKKYIGIITANYIRTLPDHHIPVIEAAETHRVTLSPDQNILDALKTVNEHGIKTVPVVDSKGILVGLINRASLVTTLSQQYIEMGDE